MAYGDSEIHTIKLVAVEGNNTDWALYWGPDHWTDQQVQESGKKIVYETAKGLLHAGGLFRLPRWFQLTYRD